MEGTNCSERAPLPEKSMREKLSQLIEDDFSKVTLVNTLKYFKQKSGKNECVGATIKILEHIKNTKHKTLLREIRKDSPISSWLPSYSQRDTKLLLSFLKQDCDIFSGDFKKTKQLTNAFPFLTRLISGLLSFHSTKFLPDHLTAFVLSLLNLRERFDIKAEERAVKRTKPKAGFKSSPVEIYPNMPEHTIENEYIADMERREIKLKTQAAQKYTIPRWI